MSLSSQRLLAAAGVWAEVRDRAQPILHIKVSDGRAGQGGSPLTLEFDHAEIEEGPMGFMIEDRVLRPALLAAVAAEAAYFARAAAPPLQASARHRRQRCSRRMAVTRAAHCRT